jgi:acyl dehydratase
VSDESAAPEATEELGELPLEAVEPIVLDRSPGILAVLVRAAWRAAGRPQGVLPVGRRFPALATQLRGVRVSSAQVAAYRAVCQLPGDDQVLPLPMPEILFFGLLGALATDARLPISPFGLIHIRQTMTGRQPLGVDRPYDLEARLAAARRTEKGYELDMRLSLAAGDTGGEDVLWQAVTTLLSRAPAARRGTRKGKPQTPVERAGTFEIQVPGDIGRAYARVSGDWNPHHLWPITARPLGYRRPIAHGMWTLARLIGQLPAEVDTTRGRVEASFHRPVLLPGTITVRVAAEGDAWALDAWSPERGTPHLHGTFKPISQA